ncbi:MAG: ABC transporter ATP-binding protein, partial [Candidatus Latescibacteria bacterium]|nr:ABC transporter ATP-binding protein [Candidatus Latescibacterota bacterium]
MYIRLLTFIRPYWWYLALSISCAAGYAALNSAGVWMIVPFVSGVFGKEVVTPPPEKTDGTLARVKSTIKHEVNTFVLGEGTSKREALRRLCLVIFLAFLLKTVVAYIQRVTITYVEQFVARDIRNRLYEHLQSLSLAYYHNKKTGDLISRLTSDVGVLNYAINVSFIGLLRDPITILFCLATMIIMSYKLTITVLIILPVCAYVITKIGRKIKRYSHRSQVGMAGITSILQETISGIRLVKAYTMEEAEVARFHRETERLRKTLVKMGTVKRIISPTTELIVVCAGMVILWVGGNEVLMGALMTPDDFLAFLGAMFLMIAPIRSLSEANSSIQAGLGASERIFDILDDRPTVVEVKDAVEITDVREGIWFGGVSFRYGDGEIVLDGIDLDVAAGEVIAIVGPSGAGKTTLVDLLPRFYDPVEGRVEIDGVDLRQISIRSLRRLIGIVSQETILFNDTACTNIAYGANGVSEAEVIASAKMACAHDFIVALDEGYQTLLGDRGV